MVDESNIDEVMQLLGDMCSRWRQPVVTEAAGRLQDPFRVLVSCIISLRTRDEVTEKASERLFAKADSPARVMELQEDEIASLIYPAGFYKTKAGQIRAISSDLVEKHSGMVPDSIDELLKFKGVGRKTANLVVTLGFGKPGICVDTHVHRITNRWGYVATGTAAETEQALRKKLPARYWILINDLLVAFGQNLCHPLSPRCSSCLLTSLCSRNGVRRSR